MFRKIEKRNRGDEVYLAAKDADILHINMKKQKLYSEGPGVFEPLSTENAKLQTNVVELTKEVQGMSVEVKDLSMKLLNSHVVECDRIEMLLKYLSPKPPST